MMSGRTPLKYRTNKGMALVMMLVLVPILMFLAVSFVDPIVRSFRAAVNDQKTLLAKSVADSTFEVALWESRGTGLGETVSGTVDREYEFGNATGEWQVIGTPEVDEQHLVNDGSNNFFYTVPAAGSGDAGGDYCSTAEPVINDGTLDTKLAELGINRTDLGTEFTPLDWPCHWNKLREGESVIIPLYTESEGVVKNPSDLGLGEFELRIRPACNPNEVGRPINEICNPTNERYSLKGDFGAMDLRTAIVLWEITAKEGDETGRQLVLQSYFNPLDLFNSSIFTPFGMYNYYSSSGMPFTLNEQSLTLLDGLPDLISNNLPNLYKPILQLLVIHTLREEGTDNVVPYIEYQFKAPEPLSGQAPISSTSKVVRVEVMIDGGYSETIEKTIALPKPVSGFVIQQ